MPANPYLDAAAKHAAPILAPTAGLPLIKSAPSLGWRVEWRRGRSRPLDRDMPEGQRKREVLRDLQTFVAWMEKEDGAQWIKTAADGTPGIKLLGPFAHFEARKPDLQQGDAGGSREVARSVMRDTEPEDGGRVEYEIHCLFRVREAVTELPTSLALDLFSQPGGRPGIRPLRDREWRQRGPNWSPR